MKSLNFEMVNWQAIEELEELELDAEELDGFHLVENAEIDYYFEMEV